jgi:hypothetical protein
VILLLLALGCTNEPPSPALVRIDPVLPDTTTRLLAVVTQDALDLENDRLTYRYEWLRDGVHTDIVSNAVPAEETERGQTWRVEVFASDGVSEGPPAVADVVIGNATPQVTVTLDPPRPTSETPIRCAGTPDDPDGDAVTYRYHWYVDGVALSVSEVLEPSFFGRGDLVYCQATPFDGESYGATTPSATAEVDNAAPIMTSVTLSEAEITRETSISADVEATDADADAITYDYDWIADGIDVGDMATLPGTVLKRGQGVYVTVTPYDEYGAGTPMRSEALVVGDSPSRITSLSLSPTTVRTDDTITATPVGVSDADGDVPVLLYTWSVAGTVVQSGTASTLSGSWFSRDQAVRVSAVADAGYGPGPAVEASVTVANSAPAITSASMSPTSVDESTTVRCSAGGYSDPDGDAAATTYAWYADGAPIAATRDVTGASFAKHQSLWCEATAHDGRDPGNTLAATPITVSNSAPTAAVVQLSPQGYASDGDTLSCDLATASTDADGDAVTYTYAWTADGVSFSWTSGSLPASRTTVGTSYECSVTPFDGEAYGATTASVATLVLPLAGDFTTSAADLTITGVAANAQAGVVGSVGDVTGDGYDDLFLGSLGSADTAWLFEGPIASSRTLGSADYELTAATVGWQFARTVAGAGDLDGNGYDDLLVTQSQYAYTGCGSGCGAVYLFYGPIASSDTSSGADSSLIGSANGDSFGTSAAPAGDVDGDGVDDLLAGAPFADPSATDGGAAYLFEGGSLSPSHASADAAAILGGVRSGDSCGQYVAGLGDVDADGYDDVAIGCPGADDSGAADAGATYVVLGPLAGTTALSAASSAKLTGEGSNDRAAVVAAGGDLDGDGVPDVVIGAPNEDSGGGSAGAVYVVALPRSGTSSLSSADARILGEPSTSFGTSVTAVGDLDGDGTAEILAGGPYGDLSPTSPDHGLAALFYGPYSGTLRLSDAPASFVGASASDAAGWSVAAPGDVDGDGFPDLAVGAPWQNAGATSDVGAVHLFSTGG